MVFVKYFGDSFMKTVDYFTLSCIRKLIYQNRLQMSAQTNAKQRIGKTSIGKFVLVSLSNFG